MRRRCCSRARKSETEIRKQLWLVGCRRRAHAETRHRSQGQRREMARCPSLGLTHLEDLGATYCFELNGDLSSCAAAYFTRLDGSFSASPGGARNGGFVKPTSILSGRPRFAHLGTSVGAAGGVISRNCAWDSREWPKWSAPHPYRTGGPPGRIPEAVVEVRSSGAPMALLPYRTTGAHAQFRLITPPAAPTEVPKWANLGRPDKIDVGFTKPPVRAPPGVCRSRTTIPTNPNHRRYVNLASSRSTIFGSAALGRTRAVFDLKVDVGFAPRGAAARGHHPGTRRNRSGQSHRPPGATAAAVRNPTSIS